MKDNNFKEKNKTRRTIINGIFAIIVVIISTFGLKIFEWFTTEPNKPETTMLCNTSVLYDGESYTEYQYSNDTFSIGSQRHNCGFTIKSPNMVKDRTSSNGFVLLDFNNEYSQVSFSVGRVEGTLSSDAILIVYIDNKYFKEYILQGNVSNKDIAIEVKNAKNLRLELKSEKDCVYGFANVLLHK